MTDRNKELLLALGWIRAGEPGTKSAYIKPGSGHQAKRMIGWHNLPRPYDNLQDAVDCVPEGASWRLSTRVAKKRGRYYYAQVALSCNPQWFDTEADTPAEALSEAIAKAMVKEGGK